MVLWFNSKLTIPNQETEEHPVRDTPLSCCVGSGDVNTLAESRELHVVFTGLLGSSFTLELTVDVSSNQTITCVVRLPTKLGHQLTRLGVNADVDEGHSRFGLDDLLRLLDHHDGLGHCLGSFRLGLGLSSRSKIHILLLLSGVGLERLTTPVIGTSHHMDLTRSTSIQQVTIHLGHGLGLEVLDSTLGMFNLEQLLHHILHCLCVSRPGSGSPRTDC